MANVSEVFRDYAESIEAEHEVREKVRDKLRVIETLARESSAMLQHVHQPSGFAKIADITAQAERHLVDQIRPALAELSSSVPASQFYRYYAMFNYTLMRLCHLCSLIHFLKEGQLLTRAATAQDWLQIGQSRADGFYLEVDDYLGGLIQTSNELARFAVNCVTNQDFERPVQICEFLSTLLAGFRLLNLKNDNLRKKFDSLKYDMKKVEEVVYDLSIRGLTKSPPTGALEDKGTSPNPSQGTPNAEGDDGPVKPQDG
ncbi:hypothetical protein TCAL_02096 [Tigriopus californicus]|uniref:Translin n=1 Tax=Tigriopus californicus TaxID=6832 RepID=A0A553NBC7_TIGCA|nr:translin-like [Tigriopus californicus]TRY62741.1 hypothetical protein TCAL_02096 [Tigriopus californicus]|eukprot:TCALIF_02096-PA protein Name:"Similar to TSN Translin (Gallus gallus)" AED:0.05 eAED:0.05 QI:0/-1/0/1/-1/1/1/0/257